MILMATYIYVDTSIIGESKRPCRLEKVCVIILYDNLYFFVFNAYLIFQIVFTTFTMLIHTKCINYAYTFHG